MARVGYTSPENMRVILDVISYLKANGFVIDAGRGNSQFVPPQAPIYIRNDSGEEIPPFACTQCTGAVDTSGQNYITVDKPVDTTGTAGGYLFNGIAPIEDGGYGIAYDGPLVRMLTDGSAVTCGADWQPMVGAWTVEPGGGQFSAVGEDDIATDVMRAFNLPSSSASGGMLQGTLLSLTGAVAEIEVVIAPCDRPELIGTTVEVTDYSSCVFDLPEADLLGVWVWASEGTAVNPAVCEWTADDRCCVAADTP